MKNSLFKKSFVLLMAVLMLFTAVPAGVFAAEESLPMVKLYTTYNDFNKSDYHEYKASVVTFTILDKIDYDAIAAAAYSWDVSAAQNGGVMAWMNENAEVTAAAGKKRYDVWLAGEGGVAANTNASNFFYGFTSLVEINGLEHLDVSQCTSMSYFFENCSSMKTFDLRMFDVSNVKDFTGMFSGCKSLESVNFKGWNTSNATNMSFMFSSCQGLTVLDISDFDTRNVIDTERMFYLCTNLKTLYTGDNWVIDQVVDSGEMFNCCYVIEGEKSFDEVPAPYDKQYAEITGGFITYKAPEAPEEYTVTYTFTGDVPEGVTAPASHSYNAGSKIKVEAVPSADGYVFSGWTTEDVVVTDGEFTVSGDVNFTGEWSKLYKVEYRYTEGYEVPAGAPELPATAYYKAGDTVDVSWPPYVERYIFIGWSTEDADVAGYMFDMPEKDVVLYGYFKIPVESIEILDTEDLVINQGDKTTLNVYVKPEDATIKTVVYESSNPDVVIIDEYNRIVAVGEGEATVTVKSEDDPTKSDTVTVTVKKPVTSIGVTPSEVVLDSNDEENKTAELTAFVNDDATNKEVSFESSDESVATVDENGKVTAVGDGEAIITVTSKDDPSKTVTVKVTVKTPVKELTVTDELLLEIDDIENVNASVNEDATNDVIYYESDNPDVARVDINGDVVALKEGTATIKVWPQDNPSLVEYVTVTVVKKYKVTYEIIGEIKPDGIAVPGEENYNNGATVTVKDRYNEEGYTFSGWSTEDAEVKDGKFVISRDVHFIGSFKKDVADVTADKTDITLTEGDKDKITVTVTPDDATNKEVTYESSDESVVRVDENGNIEAVGEGEATITVTSKDDESIRTTVTVKVAAVKYNVTYEYVGDVPENAPAVPGKEEYKAGTKVDVNKAPSVEGYDFIGWYTDAVEIGYGKFTMPEKDVALYGYFIKAKVPVADVTIIGSTNVTLEPGKPHTIIANVIPDDASNKELVYESDNESVAIVDEKGNVTTVGEGTATITVSSKENPDIKKTVTITVKKPEVYLDSITSEDIELDIGTTEKINVTFNPSDAVNKDVIYKSDDESVVTVDKDGNVTAVGSGEATITITPVGKPTAQIKITVTVNVPATDITVSDAELELEIGDSRTVTATVTPDNASDKGVTYTSSDESIVKVDKNGKITAVGEGTATVTVASASDPEVKKTVTVKVNPPKNPGYTIVVPEGVNINEGESKNLGVTITPDDGTIRPVYTSSDEGIVTVDADGNITGVKAGMAAITVDFGNGDIRVIPVVVVEVVVIPVKHHIVFGKTDGIGWYEVSVNGGDFFAQGPNSTLEVEEGSVLVVRVQDMWIDDEFDFYVNGSKVPMDAANTITVVVDGYMLIGALSMDVEVPDVDESLSFFEKLTNFFAKIINWFKDLFTW